MKHIIQTTNCFRALVFYLLFSAQLSQAQYVEFTQITDDLPAQEHPAIYGDYVVFENEATIGHPDLLLYQISTGTTTTIVSDPSSSATNPDIYDNMVVWQDDRGGDWEIYYYIIGATNPEGGQPLLVWEGDQTEPAIYGDNIVFADKKPGVTSWNIQWLQNTPGHLRRLTDDTDGDQRNPDIYKDKIVWQDQRMGNWDIYMYDIAHDEFVIITENEEGQLYPSIGEGRIVWEDWRDGDANIYMHLYFPTNYHTWDNYDWPVRLGDETPYQSNANQIRPQIQGDNLVFMDYRNGNYDIYLYRFYCDLWGDLYRITEETADQRFPAVYDKYVVWQDERITDFQDPYEADIWMWEYPPGADMMVKVYEDSDPVETGSELTYALYVWNSGPQDTENVIMTATLDDRVDHISTINISGDEGCSRVGNKITCDLGNMARGTLDTIQIKVRPTSEGRISLTAEVQSDEEDLWPSNNTYTARTDVLWQFYEKIGRGSTPSFKLDNNNKVHVVYLTDYMEGDLKYATNAMGGWITETLDEDAYGCMLDADAEGDIHIVYSKMNNTGQYYLKYRKKTDSGWEDAEEVSSNFMGFNNLDIAVAPSGIVYISYLENRWDDPIQLAYKKDGSWHGPNPLSVNAYNDQAMEVDDNGHLHFAYYAIAANPAGPQYYTNAPDSVWKTQVSIEPAWLGGQMESLNLDLALDDLGIPHISYSGSQNDDYEENHKYAVLSGGTWDYEYIEDENWSVFNTVATDTNQKAHLLYYDMEGNRLKYVNNKSGSWDYKTIDFQTEEICDNEMDALGYTHIIYSSNLELRYVTDAPEAPKPKMELTPEVIDFVFRSVGDTTDARKATIKNTGTADLLITEVRIAWPDSVNFSISHNTCDVVNPGDTCSIDVKFNPEKMGDKVALLWIESNDPDDNIQSVRLEGLGLEPFMLLYGNDIFGDVVLGDSAVSDFKIKNVGNTHLQIQGVYIQEDDSEDFYYTGLPDPPFSIDDGDSLEFQIVFKPTSGGDKTTNFRLFTNDYDATKVLTGTGVEPVFAVEGSAVTENNTIVDQGKISLFNLAANSINYSKFVEGKDTFRIESSVIGTYTLRYDPDQETYPGYLKTYLGDTPFYQEATQFTLDKDTSLILIRLAPVPPPPEGDGEISGTLVDEEGGGGGRLEYGRYAGTGTPVESAAVYLLDMDGNIIDYDYTDNLGAFTFQYIPAGSYAFYADYNFYPMDPANEAIVINTSNMDVEIVAVVENQMISARVASTTGLLTFQEGGFKAYPVPVDDQLTVMLPKSFDNQQLKIRLVNHLGQSDLLPQNAMHRSGRQLCLDGVASALTDGLYILVIEDGRNGYYTKIIKHTK